MLGEGLPQFSANVGLIRAHFHQVLAWINVGADFDQSEACFDQSWASFDRVWRDSAKFGRTSTKSALIPSKFGRFRANLAGFGLAGFNETQAGVDGTKTALTKFGHIWCRTKLGQHRPHLSKSDPIWRCLDLCWCGFDQFWAGFDPFVDAWTGRVIAQFSVRVCA